uniref:ZAD domain-containing protein n=1 Tax=Anopheles epiroticus TaxID=199890 RepID=A0A182PHX4_9DIPT
MEHTSESNLVQVQNMDDGFQKLSDQSIHNQSAQGLNSSGISGCCRLCCNDDTHLRELFVGGYKEELLLRKIFECTTVEITFDGDPDAMICHCCVAKIEEFHHYREQCRTNDVLHRNWKRRLGGHIATASSSSTILPAKYIKKEKDTEAFEINVDDFFPVDAPQQSDDTLGMHGPIASVADSSSAVNEPDTCNSPVEDEEEEEENLLEVMPERSNNRFNLMCDNDNGEYANNNGIDCDLPIKEEIPDMDDMVDDAWNDFEDDVSMSHATALVPLMESSSYSSNAGEETTFNRLIREVYDSNVLVCLVQDGFLYIQKGTLHWHCRVEDCAAAITRHRDSKELRTNGILHTHNSEVESNATDMEILQILKEPPQLESSPVDDEEPYHFITNAKQGSSLIYKGFRYSMKHTRRDGTIFWKCRAFKSTCGAGLYQYANNVFETVGTHMHGKQDRCLVKTQVKPNGTSNAAVDSKGNKYSTTKIKQQLSSSKTGIIASDSLVDQKDEHGVIRKGYEYKMVNNSKGHPRLLFDGNLYVRETKTQTDEAGEVVIWRCRRNYDMCGVAAVQHADGLVEIIGNHEHSSVKKMMKIPENMIGTKEYELEPTLKGGDALILDGYRFLKAYSRTNGMSLWRCVGSPGVVCRAKIILTTDGVAYISKTEKHLHETPKRSNKKSPVKSAENSMIRIKVPEGENKTFKKMVSSPVPLAENDKRKLNDPAPALDARQLTKPASKFQRNYRIVRNKKGYKALVYGGFRYCKIRTRQDGSISWMCRMNKKTCSAGLYQYPEGRFEWMNERRHNHSPTDELESTNPPSSSSSSATSPAKRAMKQTKKGLYHIDDETFVSSEWYLVRNRRKGTTLVHAGYRYHKKATRTDNTSIWRCSQAYAGCRAAILKYPNETIAKVEDIDHSHPAPTNGKGEEDIIFDENETMNESAHDSLNGSKDCSTAGLAIANLNSCIEEKDDPEANMRSLLNSTLDISDEANNESSYEKTIIPAAEANFRYVKNRRQTQSLVFQGYRYSRSSMRERSDGGKRWICQMNKKTCRVAVTIFPNGSMEISGQKHNHPKLPEDIEDDYADNDEESTDANASAWNDTIEDPGREKNETHPVASAEDDEHEFYFTLNRANGKSLIFQRNRFSKDYSRPDGSTIWRCMMRVGCVGRAIVRPDNTCSTYRNTYHNHPPLDVLPPPIATESTLTESNSSVTKPILPADLVREIQDASSSLIVRGDLVIYKQNRMKKTKSFPDGTAVYACAELDSCKSLVKVKLPSTEGENSSLSPMILFEWPHNHDSLLTAATETTSSSATNKILPTPDGGGGIKRNKMDYQLYKSNRGHITLVYKGYRFSLRTHNNETGNTSWKCRANRSCLAVVSFTKDGSVVRTGKGKLKYIPHNHPSNGEVIERAEPFTLDNLNPPAEDLGEFVAYWLNGVYNEVLGEKSSTPSKATERVDRHKVIYHKRFSYKLQTIKNGRECWRCSMFQTRACRAALFCHQNGTIVECTNGRLHNHEPTKQRSEGSQHDTPKAGGGFKAKMAIADETTAVAVYRGPEQPSNEEGATPPYQIVNKDGVNVLHYEKHRYVAVSKRESTEKTKRWRCYLWNSRHQCPVELTILSTDELQFVTDATHSHRPPPAELVEMDQTASMSNTKGTRKFQLMGRSERTVFYKGYKFLWKERLDGWSHYSCVCNVSHGCTVSVKINTNGYLFECSNASHNHDALDDINRCTPEAGKHESKALRQWAVASKEARLEKCLKAGSNDYTFMRSSQGVSLLFEGHRYWFHNKLSCGLHIYRCRYQKLKDCTGSVYLDAETNLVHHRFDAEHNHEPDVEDAPSNGKARDEDRIKPSPKASNEKETETFMRAEEAYADVAKKERIKKEVTITEEYSFLKDSLSKYLLLYQGYVFEFLASHYRNNGSKFYSCLYSECSASVKLLASGSLKVLAPIVHTHETPDLTDYRDIGRGSADYISLPDVPGTKPAILFEGNRYCATARRHPTDCTTMFHCYKKVASTIKTGVQERCMVSLELLPNGRVITEGTHQHPVQAQSSLLDTDVPNMSEPTKGDVIVVEGRTYRCHEKQSDGTIVWQCADDPKCKAEIYRGPGGVWVCSEIKHVLRHIVPKVINSTPTVSKPEVPEVITSKPIPLSTTCHSSSSSSSGNLRTKWHDGNRYNFYLTRRDGIQYWRCTKRMEEKCDAGILVYPSGTIFPSNNMPHTHPKHESTSNRSLSNVVHSKVLPDNAQKVQESSMVLIKSGLTNDEAGKRQNVEIQNTDERNRVYILYKDVQYALRHRRSDGIQIYECCNESCTYTLYMTRSGKIVAKNSKEHICENTTPQNNNQIASTNVSFKSLSDFDFDRPEIEDPDDLIDQNDDTEVRPIMKRIRLDNSNFVDLGQDKTPMQNTLENVHQVQDYLRRISSESDSADAATVDVPVKSFNNLPEAEHQGEEMVITVTVTESNGGDRADGSPEAEKIVSTIDWNEEHLEQNDDMYDEISSAEDDDPKEVVEEIEVQNGTVQPSQELISSDSPGTSYTGTVTYTDNGAHDSNT